MPNGNNSTRPKYVIINDCDAPEPAMVCQWVPQVGYCYLNRSGNKPRHDGMSGAEATPIEAFGFQWTEIEGKVRFELTSKPVTATYRDGAPRRWQSTVYCFEYPRVGLGVMKETAHG